MKAIQGKTQSRTSLGAPAAAATGRVGTSRVAYAAPGIVKNRAALHMQGLQQRPLQRDTLGQSTKRPVLKEQQLNTPPSTKPSKSFWQHVDEYPLFFHVSVTDSKRLKAKALELGIKVAVFRVSKITIVVSDSFFKSKKPDDVLLRDDAHLRKLKIITVQELEEKIASLTKEPTKKTLSLQERVRQEQKCGIPASHKGGDTARNDFVALDKGPYLLVEDVSGQYKPLVLVDFVRDKVKWDPPLLFLNTRIGRSPFLEPSSDDPARGMVGKENISMSRSRRGPQSSYNPSLAIAAFAASGAISSIKPSLRRPKADAPALAQLHRRLHNKYAGNSKGALDHSQKQTQRSILKRKREDEEYFPAKAPRPTPKQGFCENCDENYECYDEHIRSEKHKRWERDSNNFAGIDSLIAKIRRVPRVQRDMQSAKLTSDEALTSPERNKNLSMRSYDTTPKNTHLTSLLWRGNKLNPVPSNDIVHSRHYRKGELQIKAKPCDEAVPQTPLLLQTPKRYHSRPSTTSPISKKRHSQSTIEYQLRSLQGSRCSDRNARLNNYLGLTHRAVKAFDATTSVDRQAFARSQVNGGAVGLERPDPKAFLLSAMKNDHGANSLRCYGAEKGGLTEKEEVTAMEASEKLVDDSPAVSSASTILNGSEGRTDRINDFTEATEPIIQIEEVVDEKTVEVEEKDEDGAEIYSGGGYYLITSDKPQLPSVDNLSSIRMVTPKKAVGSPIAVPTSRNTRASLKVDNIKLSHREPIDLFDRTATVSSEHFLMDAGYYSVASTCFSEDTCGANERREKRLEDVIGHDADLLRPSDLSILTDFWNNIDDKCSGRKDILLKEIEGDENYSKCLFLQINFEDRTYLKKAKRFTRKGRKNSTLAVTIQKLTDVWIPQTSELINRVTGYSDIEERKKVVRDKDLELATKRKVLEQSKRTYESSIDDRRKCQKEINSLLQRKDAWIDTDVIRFTELYRKDMALEQTENQAKQAYKTASEDFEIQIRERYIDEQLFSDKIRKASTWWTMGLITLHLFIFVAINLREPGKTRRSHMEIQNLIKATVEAEHQKLASSLSSIVSSSPVNASSSKDEHEDAAFSIKKDEERMADAVWPPETIFGSGVLNEWQAHVATPLRPHAILIHDGIILFQDPDFSLVISRLCDQERLRLHAPRHKNSLTSVASTNSPTTFSKVVSASKDCLIVWSISTECTPMKGFGAILSLDLEKIPIPQSMAFSPDSRVVAMGCDDSLIAFKFLDNKLIKLEGHTNRISLCGFLDGFSDTILISASDDRTFKVWNITKGECCFESSIFSAYPITAFGIDSEGKHFIFGTDDGKIHFFRYNMSEQKTNHQWYCRLLLSIDCKSLWRSKVNTNESLNKEKTFDVIRTKSLHRVLSNNEAHHDVSKVESSYSVTGILSLGRFMASEPATNSALVVVTSPRGLMVINSATYDSIYQFDTQIELGVSVNTASFSPIPRYSAVDILIGDIFSGTLYMLHVGNLGRPSYSNSYQSCTAKGAWSSRVQDDCLDKLRGLDLRLDPDQDKPLVSFNHLTSSQIAVSAEKQLSRMVADSNFEIQPTLITKPISRKTTHVKTPQKASQVTNKPVTFHKTVSSSGYLRGTDVGVALKRKDSLKALVSDMPKLSDEWRAREEHGVAVVSSQNVTKHAAPALHCSFNSTGRILGTASCDKTIRLTKISVKEQSDKILVLNKHSAGVKQVVWGIGEDKLLSCSQDGEALLWTSKSSEPLLSFRPPTSANDRKMDTAIADIKFFRKDQRIAVLIGKELQLLSYNIEKVGLRDIKPALNYNTFKKRASLGFSHYPNAIGVANTFFSHISIICKGQNIQIVDMEKFQAIFEVEKAHSRAIHTVSLADYPFDLSCNVRNLFLTSSPVDCLRCWDVRSPSSPVFRLVEHVNRYATTHSSFSPCGNYIAVGSEDKQGYIYDTRKMSTVAKLSNGVMDVVTSAQFHPTKPKVSVSCQDGKVLLFNL
ncbi:WD repeat-containing protein 27 [Dinochytrium kinnereticum]|nr:WD repeat-containing protein 27 [Dinochytrium kinnereticum]